LVQLELREMLVGRRARLEYV